MPSLTVGLALEFTQRPRHTGPKLIFKPINSVSKPSTDICDFPTKSVGVSAKIKLAKVKLLHKTLETGVNSLYINLSLLLESYQEY